MADYTTPALIKQMKAEGKPIERDFTFGLQQYEIKEKEGEAAVAPTPRKPKVELNLPEVRILILLQTLRFERANA